MRGIVKNSRAATKLVALGSCLTAALATCTLVAPMPSAFASGGPVVTNCDDSGPGSLRQAVADAASGDTVTFALSPACSVITLTSGKIDIYYTDLAIDGPGASVLAVDGNHHDTVFDAGGGSVTISGLTVQNGKSGSSTAGGIAMNSGSLTVEDSVVTGNSSSFNGGGIDSASGGASLKVIDSTLANNTGPAAGGISASSGGLTVTGTTFTGNSSPNGSVGGIRTSGNATVSNSTFAANSACGAGALWDNQGTTQVSSSTFSHNTATCGFGGSAIFNGDNNSAVTTVSGSIFDSETCTGAITDGGFNLDTGHDCATSTANSSLIDTPASLDANGLQSNGGPTQTIALQPQSKAIGLVNSAQLCSSTDQRGHTRPTPICDAGAYQTPPPVISDMFNSMNSDFPTVTGPNAVSVGDYGGFHPRIAMAFTPTSTGPAQLMMVNATCVVPYPSSTTCSGSGTVAIESDSGGVPSGTVLGTMTFSTFNSLSAQGVDNECGSVSQSPQLNAGTQYWAVMDSNSELVWMAWTDALANTIESDNGGPWFTEPTPPGPKTLALRIDTGSNTCQPVATENPTSGTEVGENDMFTHTGRETFDTISIKNEGLSPLTLSRARITGDDASLFSLRDSEPGPLSNPYRLPKQLGLNGLTILYPTCTGGTDEGTYHATLTLTTSDPNKPTLTWPLTCLVDDTPPTITFDNFNADGNDGWFVSSPAKGTVAAHDPGSGDRVINITCSDDDGSGFTASAPFAFASLSEEGVHHLSCNATDVARNTTPSPYTYTVKVDTKRPTATPKVTPTPNAAGWNNTAATASFDCSDATPGSGVVTDAAGGGDVTSNTAGQEFTSSGCTDDAGWTATPAAVTVKVDLDQPTIKLTAHPDKKTLDTSASFTAEGTDVGPSGIAGHLCALDPTIPADLSACDATTTFTGLAPGSHSVSYEAIDVAGNVSDPVSFTWTVLKPQTIDFTSAPTSGFVGDSDGLQATATSGLDVSYAIDDSSDPGVCSIINTTVHYLASGTCVVDADQSGDDSYGAAPQAQASIDVQGFVPPSKPSITGLTSGDGWIDVAFDPPSAPGSTPITGYTVTATPAVGPASVVHASSPPGSVSAHVPAGATRALIAGLTDGTAYTVTVTAHSSTGTGPASAAAGPVTPTADTEAFTTHWDAAGYARLVKSASYLGITTDKMQLTSVYVVAYILGAAHLSGATPLSPPALSGPHDVTTSYTAVDQVPLKTVMRQFALTPSESQYLATQIVGYLFALGGH